MSVSTLRRAVLLSAILVPSLASADGLPRLVPDGEHRCKVSREYKLRKCRVVSEGRTQVLSLYEPGHLLMLEGVLHPNDHMGKSQKVFFEARITEDHPYLCSAKDPAALAACKAQTLMIPLTKKGGTWVGRFPVKHYWDRWVGDGDARHVEGYEVTVDELTFTIKLGK